MTPEMTRAFERAIGWLELDRILPDGVGQILSERFQFAVKHPDAYLAFWSPKNVVQVFGGKAVVTKIPSDAHINDEMCERCGRLANIYLALPHYGAVFLHNASEVQRAYLGREVSEAYSTCDNEHRMELVVV